MTSLLKQDHLLNSPYLITWYIFVTEIGKFSWKCLLSLFAFCLAQLVSITSWEYFFCSWNLIRFSRKETEKCIKLRPSFFLFMFNEIVCCLRTLAWKSVEKFEWSFRSWKFMRHRTSGTVIAKILEWRIVLNSSTNTLRVFDTPRHPHAKRHLNLIRNSSLAKLLQG